jgi:hypothetical protein
MWNIALSSGRVKKKEWREMCEARLYLVSGVLEYLDSRAK